MSKSYKNDKTIVQAAHGAIIEHQYTRGKNKGKTQLRFEWNPGFTKRFQTQYASAQDFVDTEVLRKSSAYIPVKTNMLQKSGILGTVIGSGEVQWVAPYARGQYYHTADTRSYDPKRGAHWFERMKADYGKAILSKAKKIGGGSE